MQKPILSLCTAGLMVCTGASLNATAAEPASLTGRPGTATSAGERLLFPTEQGWSLEMKLKQQPVNPYLSIGGNLLYFDRAHRWALAGELGMVYTGDPTIDLNWSGRSTPLIDRALRNHRSQIQDYADQFTWYPVVKSW